MNLMSPKPFRKSEGVPTVSPVSPPTSISNGGHDEEDDEEDLPPPPPVESVIDGVYCSLDLPSPPPLSPPPPPPQQSPPDYDQSVESFYEGQSPEQEVVDETMVMGQGTIIKAEAEVNNNTLTEEVKEIIEKYEKDDDNDDKIEPANYPPTVVEDEGEESADTDITVIEKSPSRNGYNNLSKDSSFEDVVQRNVETVQRKSSSVGVEVREIIKTGENEEISESGAEIAIQLKQKAGEEIVKVDEEAEEKIETEMIVKEEEKELKESVQKLAEEEDKSEFFDAVNGDEESPDIMTQIRKANRELLQKYDAKSFQSSRNRHLDVEEEEEKFESCEEDEERLTTSSLTVRLLNNSPKTKTHSSSNTLPRVASKKSVAFGDENNNNNNCELTSKEFVERVLFGKFKRAEKPKSILKKISSYEAELAGLNERSSSAAANYRSQSLPRRPKVPQTRRNNNNNEAQKGHFPPPPPLRSPSVPSNLSRHASSLGMGSRSNSWAPNELLVDQPAVKPRSPLLAPAAAAAAAAAQFVFHSEAEDDDDDDDDDGKKNSSSSDEGGIYVRIPEPERATSAGRPPHHRGHLMRRQRRRQQRRGRAGGQEKAASTRAEGMSEKRERGKRRGEKEAVEEEEEEEAMAIAAASREVALEIAEVVAEAASAASKAKAHNDQKKVNQEAGAGEGEGEDEGEGRRREREIHHQDDGSEDEEDGRNGLKLTNSKAKEIQLFRFDVQYEQTTASASINNAKKQKKRKNLQGRNSKTVYRLTQDVHWLTRKSARVS